MKSEILKSWEENAPEWIEVIQNQEIGSRKFTNQAVLDVIVNLRPKKVADLGCGEGWLTRELTKREITAYGFEAIAPLIEHARTKGPETYHQFTFEAIINGVPLPNLPFDLAVFNFCLYLEEGLSPLLQNTLNALTPDGHLVIQTLHPYFLIQNGKGYQSQWLSNSWKGLPGNFKNGHAWYARTFEDWSTLISELETVTFQITEVVDDHKHPVSLIIVIKKHSKDV